MYVYKYVCIYSTSPKTHQLRMVCNAFLYILLFHLMGIFVCVCVFLISAMRPEKCSCGSCKYLLPSPVIVKKQSIICDTGQKQLFTGFS